MPAKQAFCRTAADIEGEYNTKRYYLKLLFDHNNKKQEYYSYEFTFPEKFKIAIYVAH